MFVTTFAPFYPTNHSRHGFQSGNCFILLQPEISFAQYDLTPDTPHTEWANPKTMRDKTRCAYKAAGRGYRIRETIYFPTAWDIVKHPDDGDGQAEETVVEWWKDDEALSVKTCKDYDQPTEGDEVSAESDEVSTEGDDMSAEGDEVSAEGDEVSAEGDEVSAEGGEVPSEGDDMPT